jgi:glutamyl-tRNA synthetase
MNGQYLKKKSDFEWVQLLRQNVFTEDYLLQLIPLVKERVCAFEEFIDNTSFFFNGDLKYDEAVLPPKGVVAKDASNWLVELLEKLEGLQSWTVEHIKEACENYCKEKEIKTKDLFMTLRIVISGGTVSPPLFETIHVLGKEMTRRRMRLASDSLKKR